MHNIRIGGLAPLPLDLLEMGLPQDLAATVLAIEPCPPLATGAGQTVLTTVNHLSDDVHELTIRDSQGNRETIRTTSGHKFYSATRTAWLAASDLQPGEHLDSPVEVVAFHPYPGRHRVYNLTIQNDHVYRVSSLAALVHNNLCGRVGTDSGTVIQTWNQFQSATAGQFGSRGETAAAWNAYKLANGLVIGTTRTVAARSDLLKRLADNSNTPRWMKQWLVQGKTPPGYDVDHIVPLSVGGLDEAALMRLQARDLHRLHHQFYRPWE